MNSETEEIKKPNHKRNAIVVIAVVTGAAILWNVVGAVQCLSIEGDVQLHGFGLRCYKDYSAS